MAQPPAQSAPPVRPLYSPLQVGLATLLGWPIAGSALLSANYRKLGDRDAASMVFFLGMLGTAMLMSLLFILPRSAGSAAALIGMPAFGMYLIAGSAQGAACARSRRAGAPGGSWAWAVGIGLACGLATLGLLAAFPPDEAAAVVGTVTVAPGEEVQFTRAATESRAQRLGQFLKEIGYFNAKWPKTVRLDKRRGTFLISFALKAGRWRNPNHVRVFREMCADMASRVFDGHPIELRLCNRDMEPKKTLRPPS